MPRRLVLTLIALGLLMAVSAAPVAAGGPFITTTKADTPDPVLPGGILTYTIVLTNCSECMPGTVTVQDPIPAGTSLQSATATTGTVTTLPGSVQWQFFLMGTTETLTITVLVDPGTPPGTVIQNTATVSATTFQGSALAQTTVVAPAATPAASLANAATSPPGPASPLVALGFAALLIGSLGTLAFANVRPPVSRPAEHRAPDSRRVDP